MEIRKRGKVERIFVPMKSIKIPEAVHTELTVFAAKKGDSIQEHAGFAIMEYLKKNSHEFVVKSNSKPKKSTK